VRGFGSQAKQERGDTAARAVERRRTDAAMPRLETGTRRGAVRIPGREGRDRHRACGPRSYRLPYWAFRNIQATALSPKTARLGRRAR
jgi:hypothetical protein